jgi:pantoate--beta-alanine ligase
VPSPMTSTATTETMNQGPRVLDTPAELRLQSDQWRAAGMSIGLVPTMGALHEGHRSLVRRARAECDRVAVSIFVNPTQFGPGEDLARYPRSLHTDLGVLAEERADAVFVPGLAAMYPEGLTTTVRVNGALVELWEGSARRGHLDGVALVVTKLLVAARADRAYFGAKDAQQCAVVRRLARDLDTGTEIVVCPTVRDPDGLALSSRNRYLDAEQRCQALAIPRGLAAAGRAFASGVRASAELIDVVGASLAESPALNPEYVAVVDADTFAQVDAARVGSKILVAARIGTARLVDTLALGIDELPKPGGVSEPTAVGGGEPGVAERSRPCTVP